MQKIKRIIYGVLLLIFVLSFSVVDGTVLAAPGSSASIHMNGGTGYIFRLVFDTSAGANVGEQSIVIPGNGTAAAVYTPSGVAMAIHDQLIYVLVTDTNGVEIGTILPNAIGPRGGSNYVLQADGSMGSNGQMLGNSGTINFWFNGFSGTPQPSASYLVANKVWLNADGSLFTGAPPSLSFLLNGPGTVNVPMLPGVPVLVQDGNYTITEPTISGYQLVSIVSGTMLTDLPGRAASANTIGASGNYSATFTNMVIPISAPFVLEGVKSGDNPLVPFNPETFGFIVQDSNGKIVATGTNRDDTITPPTGTRIVFSPIIYTAADVGTHIYTIREVSTADTDWSIDSKRITVEVTVSLVGNTIVATQLPDAAGIEFENTYNTGISNIQIFPTATKEISGVKAPLEAEQFSFVIKDTSGAVVSTGTNAANGVISFTPITYSVADIGTHTYTVEEVLPLENGWNLIPGTRTMTVVVTSDGTTLTAIASYSPSPIVFQNYYTSSGYLSLAAHKTTSGSSLKNGQFNFTVMDEFGIPVATGTNDANGNIGFSSIRYANYIAGSEGFHIYTIVESSVSGSGWTTSTVSYPVLVRVTDNGNGTMSVTPFNLNTDNFVFVNTYGSAGSVTLNATKRVNPSSMALTDKQFEFAVTNESGVIVATGTNDAAGNIAFSPIQYTNNDVGVHHYTIFETSAGGAVSGGGMWTPSSVAYHVSVTVVDNGDGTITATPLYPRMGLVFINTFTQLSDPVGSISLTATKKVVGAQMVGGEFAFAVLDENGITVATGTNDINGNVTFSAIPYTISDVGRHNYTIVETTPVAPFWQMDNTEFNVSVDVVEGFAPDNTTWALLATSNYPSGGVNFTNTFSPPDRMLSITKSFVGFQGFNVFDPTAISPITFLVVGTNSSGTEVFRQTVAFDSSTFQWNPNLRSYTAALHNLPAGNYTVYERGGFAPGYVNNRPNPPQTASVSNSSSGAVSFINEYTIVPLNPPDPGDPTDPGIPENHPALTVNKVFHGIRNVEIPSGFRVVITGPGGFRSTLSLSDALSGTGGVFTNLASGTYTITEQNNTVPGFFNTVSINGQAVKLPYSFQITQDTGHLMITVDNNYTANVQSPQTGVDRAILLPILLIAAAVMCVAGAEIYRRKMRLFNEN